MAALLDSPYSALPAQRASDPTAAAAAAAAAPDARPAESRTSSKIAELLINDINDSKPEARDPKMAPTVSPADEQAYLANVDTRKETLPPIESADLPSEMSLREHLLAAQAGVHPPQSFEPQPAHVAMQPPRSSPPDAFRHADANTAHPGDPAHAAHRPPMVNPSNYDPHVMQQGQAYEMGGQVDTDMNDGSLDAADAKRGGKRELSQSKRAAQNRAAQRAFRQRKEGYIKKLEEENRQMKIAIDDSYASLQAENYQLRDYCLTLQTRLQEVQGTYPPPPVNLHARDARPAEPVHQLGAEPAAMATSAVTQLQQAAGGPVPPGYESARQEHQHASAYPRPNGADEQRAPEPQPPQPSSDPALERRA